jgi:hypothetical protein
MARADFLAAVREQVLEEERRPPAPQPPATPPERVLALQRAAGNHAVAALLGQQAKPGRPTLARGRLTNTVDYIEEKWDEFREHSDDVDAILQDFTPMLAGHTKGAGMTKKKKKATKKSGLEFDPDKPRAMDVANGLSAWVTSSSEGAERYYAEMRSAIVQEGEPSLDWQFGVSDITEPDVHTMGGTSIESKRTTGDQPAAVDTLIREARFQTTKRVTMPDDEPYTAWRVAIEIAADNPWPYTATELKKAGITASSLPSTILKNPGALPEKPDARALRRNLAPQKGGKTSAVPMDQVGNHEIVVNWLKHGLQWQAKL